MAVYDPDCRVSIFPVNRERGILLQT